MGIGTGTGTDVRPFQVEIPEEELAELRRRIEGTRWPSKELVADRSLPNAMLLTYPDAGHGSLFQFHDSFVQQATLFLDS